MSQTQVDLILDGTVSTSDIANSAITTLKIADANVTTAKIADGSVTLAKFGTDANAKLAQPAYPFTTKGFSMTF